jgi:hypothetical protein
MRSNIQTFLENIFYTSLSIPKIVLKSTFFGNTPNQSFDGKEAVILGNGPSLNQSLVQHADFIKDKFCLAVNLFCATEAYNQIKPSVLVMAAPEFFDPNVDPSYEPSVNAFFDGLINSTQWPLTFVVPHEIKKFKGWQNRIASNSNIQIQYFNNTPVEGFEWFCGWMMNWGLAMPRPHNVLIPSLIYALRMGFKSIYLFGADHSWLQNIWVDDENRVLLVQKHFYDEHSAKPNMMLKRGKGGRNMAEVLDKFLNTFKAYYLIGNFAEGRNQKIFNCTPDSYIDAFERRTI